MNALAYIMMAAASLLTGNKKRLVAWPQPWLYLLLTAATCGVAQAGQPKEESDFDLNSVLTLARNILALPLVDHSNGRTLRILYPSEGVIFPPEIVSPKIQWEDEAVDADSWIIVLGAVNNSTSFVCRVRQKEWTPSRDEWEEIKQISSEHWTAITILGVKTTQAEVVSSGQARFKTSRDRVDAAIFFREVPLPFIEAARNPTQIRWRLGRMDIPGEAETVWQNSPVCANCHSFSRDNRSLAMDIDYPTKGSQVITGVGQDVALKAEDVIQWENASTPPGGKTFGLLSQISPDGKWVVSTVNDEYLMWGEGFAFSQFFLPVRGVLAVYNRDTREFKLLKGADDPDYVQTNPAWSPDGRFLLFARARALAPHEIVTGPLPDGRRIQGALEQRGGFRFEILRLPFNEGRGGEPEPVLGASGNGRSNYFPKYSPGGRWVVFCQSRNYMFLQPDSELYIIPSSGGEARRLAANTISMNSWHSWSPNSRWLVFASKALAPFTQLFLTHVDEFGESSTPVRLGYLSSPERAANLPEFVSAPFPAQFSLQFAQDESQVKAGNELFASGHIDEAMEAYRQAVRINPAQVEARQKLGLLLQHVKGDTNAALAELMEASRLAPKNAYLHHDLGLLYLHSGRLDPALHHLQEATRQLDNREDNNYNPYDNRYKWGFLWRESHSRSDLVHAAFLMHLDLAQALFVRGELEECIKSLERLTQRDGRNFVKAHSLLARAYAAAGQHELSRASFARARQLNPRLAKELAATEVDQDSRLLHP